MNDERPRCGVAAVLLAASLAAIMAACASAPAQSSSAASGEAAAPWSAAPLAAAVVPDVYVTAWTSSENRQTCALVAIADAALTGDAAPRIATFGGGWGVAWDQPGVRSAFGVAGTGVDAADPSYDEWPHRLTWSDGSSAGYGPEGGTGPNQLAYLRIAGQQCLYNVWSRLGRSHLEQLLGSLRYVRTAG